MEVFNRRIRYGSRTDVFSLWFLGDLHVGAASCDEGAIKATVKAIKSDPLALWLGVGDLAEFISPHDWRFRLSQLAQWVRDDELEYGDDIVNAQIERVIGLLKPIADKCLGLLCGNHEDRQLTTFDRNVHRAVWQGMLAECKEVQNLQDEALGRLTFTRGRRGPGHTTTLDIYVHHGWFAGRKSGAKVNNLHDLLLSWNVDIVAVGHGHERVIAPPFVTMKLDANGQPAEWRRYALMTGSYFRSHQQGATSYSSTKGYRPNDIGAVRLYYQPDKGRLWGEV